MPPRVIVAVWGLESNFGQFTGVRPTISALATLAYDARRATYFRGELLDALRILDRGDIELASMKGSWAGAMGQPQFMPSSYLRFAEDFDGDGRRDIWASPADVFASIANYLKAHGWTPSWILGTRGAGAGGRRETDRRSVAPRTGGCDASGRAHRTACRSRAGRSWACGCPATSRCRTADIDASLSGPARGRFLVYRNYDAILAYNCAHAYALSVGLLADRIGR